MLTVSAAPFYINGTVGNNVYIDSLQSPAPGIYSPTQAQQDAITRVNFYRNLMGIPAARHHLALGLAAMAHAKYLSDTDFIDNNGDPHIETLGASPDFTAPGPGDETRTSDTPDKLPERRIPITIPTRSRLSMDGWTVWTTGICS